MGQPLSKSQVKSSSEVQTKLISEVKQNIEAWQFETETDCSDILCPQPIIEQQKQQSRCRCCCRTQVTELPYILKAKSLIQNNVKAAWGARLLSFINYKSDSWSENNSDQENLSESQSLLHTQKSYSTQNSTQFLIILEGISQDLLNILHPLKALLNKFQRLFVQENRYLLFQQLSDENQEKLMAETSRCIHETKIFIAIFKELIISFYDLQNLNNIKREQLENFTISQVLRDCLYVFIFNLIFIGQQKPISTLKLMLDQAVVTLQSLQVRQAFRLDFEERSKLIITDEDELPTTPYIETIKQLKAVRLEQSPLLKLEMIFNALKQTMPKEIELFWAGTNRMELAKDRQIDPDNLQAICIYIIGQMKQPTLLIECFIISEYLTKFTRDGTRSYYLNVVKASLDWYLEMKTSVDVDSLQKEDVEKTIEELKQSALSNQLSSQVIVKHSLPIELIKEVKSNQSGFNRQHHTQIVGQSQFRRRVTVLNTEKANSLPTENVRDQLQRQLSVQKQSDDTLIDEQLIFNAQVVRLIQSSTKKLNCSSQSTFMQLDLLKANQNQLVQSDKQRNKIYVREASFDIARQFEEQTDYQHRQKIQDTDSETPNSKTSLNYDDYSDYDDNLDSIKVSIDIAPNDFYWNQYNSKGLKRSLTLPSNH